MKKRSTLISGRRFLLLIVALSLIILVAVYYITDIRQTETPVYSCYLDYDSKGSKEEPQQLEDVLFADIKPTPGNSIFFLETKCNCSNHRYSILNFTAHQACAVEAAALHHSSYDVFVLFACPTIRQQNDPILDAMLSYENVQIRSVNLWRFAEGSPIEDWLKKDDLFRTEFLMINISDLLRLLTLYRYGGIYLDEDVIMFQSLEDEVPNFMGAETNTSIGNSVLGLEPDGFGHMVAELLLNDFQRNYLGNVWAHNGPKLLVRMMTRICGTNDVNAMQEDSNICHGIKVFDINAFYEINWTERSRFFHKQFADETLKRLKDSYAMHTWNHIKTNWPFRVGSSSAYMQLVAQHCPRVFAATGKYFT
ncbi:lactosylceramide 4-alpha-galactosyltransferase-like [Drosophila albomicans]|uniref:Lactosylceramide 4-alpha-galactosyltransferase-like n=1 Tax=Drosophila albomicans TaxID=7291 RepID=A0A6P8WB27_DROAB|nr:lactosylceramide 4-alpha-galactosyltransferase-like [Drosophila albomicans]XP_051858166.1 lactosylceramide 4-alpha-galactosyltransferase-like [Drosophila albomicans]